MDIGEMKIFHAQEVDSTNLWAAREAANGAAHGSLYVADRQTAGRGRLARGWQSEGAGLYMTLLLRPEAAPDRLARAPLIAAVAVSGALDDLGADARIKWPNDVVIAGKKVCGILCESRVAGMRACWVTVGVGINLAQRERDFAPEHRQRATSLAMELGQEIRCERVIGGFLEHIKRWYGPGFEGDSTFWQEYRLRSATLGQPVRVIEGTGEWEGIASDILPDGALEVNTESGPRAVYAGDVSIRGKDGYV